MKPLYTGIKEGLYVHYAKLELLKKLKAILLRVSLQCAMGKRISAIYAKKY
jgi:hypothetical protein